MLVKSYPHSTMYFFGKYIFFDLAEKSFFSIFPKKPQNLFCNKLAVCHCLSRGSTLDLKPLRRLRIRGFWSGQPLTYSTRYNVVGKQSTCFPALVANGSPSGVWGGFLIKFFDRLFFKKVAYSLRFWSAFITPNISPKGHEQETGILYYTQYNRESRGSNPLASSICSV